MQQQQEKIRTIHIFYKETEPPMIDADPDPEPESAPPPNRLALICLSLVALLCLAIPIGATLLATMYPNTYDSSISQTITLTLAEQPTATQLRLYKLPQIKESQNITVAATGSQHQNATHATGLTTFYNGLFTSQTVPSGTTLKGKDGVSVVTLQTAVLPPATPTTPPTYGTVSVTASSVVAGSAGNIAASDIDEACCAPSVLAQNLYAFSGGQDARDVLLLTKTDLTTGTQQVTSQVDSATHDQAQAETKPGYILLPLTCSHRLSANHQAGDLSANSTITLTETCTPLAYFAPDIAAQARQQLTIPNGYQLVSFTVVVVGSQITTTGGTLTVRAIAYLKRVRPVVSPYRFVGK